MTTCMWCEEELRFEPGRGWVHLNGQMYKTLIVDGVERDDHCALPKAQKPVRSRGTDPRPDR